MKKLILTTIVLATAALVWHGCNCNCEPEPKPALRICGTISDKISGEPVQNAIVELIIEQTAKAQTKTNSNGMYEFTELKAGTYTIRIERIGYKKDSVINIVAEAGEEIRVDRLLERLPAVLKVVNENNQAIDSLTFGNDKSVTSLAFTILNVNADTLRWEIEIENDWISISETAGAIPSGCLQSIAVTIDRKKLNDGLNKHILNILSNYGYKALVITAIGEKKEDVEE